MVYVRAPEMSALIPHWAGAVLHAQLPGIAVGQNRK